MAGNFEAVRKEISAEVLRILTNNCVMPRLLKRNFNEYWSRDGRRIGASLDIRKPLRVIGADGQGFQPEGLTRVTVPMTINYWNQQSFQYNDTEEAMFLDANKRTSYLRPHVINLANKIDRLMLQFMQATTPNWVGVLGTTPTLKDTYNSAQTKLNQLLALGANRSVVYSSSFNQNLVGAGSTLFNPQNIIGKQYLTGKVGRYAEFDFFIDEQVPAFTAGTYAGAGQVNGANQQGSSIAVNNFTGGSVSLVVGDHVTFAGCFDINLQSRLPYPGVLKQFVVTAPVTDAAGALNIPIFPAIITSGQYQNCSASPTNGGAVTIQGASGALGLTAFAFQEEAYEWAAIELMDVSEFGAKCDTVTDPETGITARCVWQWNNNTGEVTCRMDAVWGIAGVYSEQNSCIIFG